MNRIISLLIILFCLTVPTVGHASTDEEVVGPYLYEFTTDIVSIHWVVEEGLTCPHLDFAAITIMDLTTQKSEWFYLWRLPCTRIDGQLTRIWVGDWNLNITHSYQVLEANIHSHGAVIPVDLNNNGIWEPYVIWMPAIVK